MSRTVGMVPVSTRRRTFIPRPSCTACGAPLVDAVGLIRGKLVTNALACSTCGRLGVHCDCRERLS